MEKEYKVKLRFPNTKEIQRQYLKTIDEGQVYCSIAGKEISSWACLETQGQPDCFGCAAYSRFCEKCSIYPIAFPEIELCDQCLQIALELKVENSEKENTPDLLRGAPIHCELVDKKIGEDTCKKMQGASCGLCISPARICTKCKDKPVKYHQYGLCLSCTISAFSPGWKYDPTKIQQVTLAKNNDKPDATPSEENKSRKEEDEKLLTSTILKKMPLLKRIKILEHYCEAMKNTPFSALRILLLSLIQELYEWEKTKNSL